MFELYFMLQSLVSRFCIETASAVSWILHSQYKITTMCWISSTEFYYKMWKVLQSSAEVQPSKGVTPLLFLKYLSFYTEQPFPSFKLPTVLWFLKKKKIPFKQCRLNRHLWRFETFCVFQPQQMKIVELCFCPNTWLLLKTLWSFACEVTGYSVPKGRNLQLPTNLWSRSKNYSS